MLGVELDDCPCVVDHRFDLWAAAYDCLVLDQPVDPLGSELGDLDGVEVSERLADPVPLRLDHAPVHAGRKHQPAECFEVTGKVLRSLLCWWGHSAPFSDGHGPVRSRLWISAEPTPAAMSEVARRARSIDQSGESGSAE